MIIEKNMYTVKCDGCGKESGAGESICAWQEKWFAEEEAIDTFDWLQVTEWDSPGLAREKKHYCPDCYEYDEDKDCKRPKVKR